MTTGVIRGHLATHGRLYLEKIIRHQWPILYAPLLTLTNGGWSLQELVEQLKQDPSCDIFSLGLCAGGVLPGASALDNDLPDYSIKEMHQLMVKFIIADDQVSTHLLSAHYY
jgi:hypothetical protein